MIAIKRLDELHIDELSSYLNHYQEITMFMRNNLYHSGITYQDAPFHGEYYGSFEIEIINLWVKPFIIALNVKRFAQWQTKKSYQRPFLTLSSSFNLFFN